MSQKELSRSAYIRQQILALIDRMDFEYSTRLPSEHWLAAKLQVSRSTIRSVLAGLEVEGKIIRRHGSGTYVNPQAMGVESTLYTNMNMYDLICKNGYTPGVKVLQTKTMPAGEERASKLGLFPNEPVIESHSVYFADGVPCMYCVDCVDAKRFSALDWNGREQYGGSIHDYIRQELDIDISWDIIRILGAHSGQRPELQMWFSGSDRGVKPLVLLDITNFDSHNQASLLGNIYVDTDKISLNVVRDFTKV